MVQNITADRREAPPSDDFDSKQAIRECITMLNALGAFSQSDLLSACGTHLFIHLHDLAQRARVLGKTITFTSDVDPKTGVATITDLVSKMRNAVCHIRSPERKIGEGSFVFSRILGRAPNAFNINGVVYGCDYEDDVAIYYGVYRFYVRRHGHRMIEELIDIFGKP